VATFREIVFGTPEYTRERALREEVLRTPLGLTLSERDLAGEEDQLHFGLFEPGDRLVACAVAVKLSPTEARIRQMAVSPRRQRKGLGRRLLEELERDLRARGFETFLLNARKSAVEFYEKLGYTVVGEEFDDVTVPHVRMAKPGPGGRGPLRSLGSALLILLSSLSAGAQTGAIQEFPVAFGKPQGIATGPDGNLWVVEADTSRIAQVSPAGSILREIELSPGSVPMTIVTGPDGNLWFTESGTNRIGQLSRLGTLTAEFPVGAAPETIAVGPDGNLWFTEPAANRIGRMDTRGRLLGEFAVPTANSRPRGIAAGPCGDNHVWFTEEIGRIGRIDAAGNVVELANTGIASHLRGITPGPAGDCNLYVADRGQDCIVKISTTGQFLVIFLAIGSLPTGIVAGPDGRLWFAEAGLNRIGRMETSGVLGPQPAVPSPSTFPEWIAVGPDANIWFTETDGNRLGRVITGSSPAPPPTPTPPPGVTIVPRHATPAPRPFRTPQPGT